MTRVSRSWDFSTVVAFGHNELCLGCFRKLWSHAKGICDAVAFGSKTSFFLEGENLVTLCTLNILLITKVTRVLFGVRYILTNVADGRHSSL